MYRPDFYVRSFLHRISNFDFCSLLCKYTLRGVLMFRAKRGRIKKQFKKDFGVELSNEEADKVINYARSKKFEQIDDFIQKKVGDKQ